MKDAKKVEEKSDSISKEIQRLFQKLKDEKKEVKRFADPDELDQHVMTEVMRAMARRMGLKQKINICYNNSEPYVTLDGYKFTGLKSSFKIEMAVLPVLAGILACFAYQLSGKKYKFLFAKGTEQLIKLISSNAFKTFLKGGAMVVGGAVGMAFALDEAIDNWKDLIKKNYVTKASQSLRDTAEAIEKMTRTLREQLDSIKKMLKEMAKREEQERRFQLQYNAKKLMRSTKSVPEKIGNNKTCVFIVILLGILCFYLKASFRSDHTVVESVENENSPESQQTYEDIQQGEQPEYDKGDEEEKENGRNEQGGGEQSGGGDQGDDERDSEDEESVESEEESESEEETEDKKEKSNKSPPAEVKVGLLNLRSMNNKGSKVNEIITENTLDVFLSTETWLQKDTGDEVLTGASPQNFNSFHQDRDGRRGGGVAIQFSNLLQGDPVYFDFLTTFECVGAVLKHDTWSEPILFLNMYHPPGYNLSKFRAFLDEFQMVVNEANKLFKNIVITGDFNIWVDFEKRSATDEFEFFLLINNLYQHVGEPTHKSGHFLDLVITRNVEISNLFVRDDGVSDHYTVYFNAKPKSNDKKKKKKRKTDEDDEVKRNKKSEE